MASPGTGLNVASDVTFVVLDNGRYGGGLSVASSITYAVLSFPGIRVSKDANFVVVGPPPYLDVAKDTSFAVIKLFALNVAKDVCYIVVESRGVQVAKHITYAVIDSQLSPSPSVSPTPSPSASRSPSASFSKSISPSASKSPSGSFSPSASRSESPSASESKSPSASPFIPEFPIFIYVPSMGCAHGIRREVPSNIFGDGYSITDTSRETAFSRADGVKNISSYKGLNIFKIGFTHAATGTEKLADLLFDFFQDRLDNVNEPFYFYNPTEKNPPDPTGEEARGRYLVRMKDPNQALTREYFKSCLYRYGIDLEECKVFIEEEGEE